MSNREGSTVTRLLLADGYGNPEHDCTEHLLEAPDDPLLPEYVEPLTCEVCGEFFERDTRDGEVTVGR